MDGLQITDVYDFTVSKIDGNGHQYYTGMLELERPDSHGMRWGKAFHIELDHVKQKTQLYTFMWKHGVPQDMELVAEFKDEIIVESEVPELLRKYNLISRR